MPLEEKIPIERLLESYETALAQTGYSISTKLLLVKRAELNDSAASECRSGIL